MAYVPPTAAQLRAEVVLRVGRPLADAGLYAPDPTTGAIPAVDAGLRRGAAAVGMATGGALTFTDDDAANLTPFAAERVADEAERFCLGFVVLNWYRVLQKHREPVESTPDLGGWLGEQKASIKARLADLKAQLAEPYREPSDPMVVATPFIPFGRCWPPDAVRPGAVPYLLDDPCLWPVGYVPWSWWGAFP